MDVLRALPDYSLDIPPFLRRVPGGGFRYPHLTDGTLYPPRGPCHTPEPTSSSAPSPAAITPDAPASTPDQGNAALSYSPPIPPLPSDPFERLSALTTIARGAPPPTRKPTDWELARKEQAYKRIARMKRKKELATKRATSVPLEGRAAWRRILGED